MIERRVVVPGDKKDDAVGTTVVHRRQTHRAGMREDIERTIDEMFRVQLGRGFSDRQDLGVRRILRLDSAGVVTTHGILGMLEPMTYDSRKDRRLSAFFAALPR